MIKCEVCNELFDNLSDLLNHVTKTHRRQHPKISSIEYYDKYIKHTKKCKYCDNPINFGMRFTDKL